MDIFVHFSCFFYKFACVYANCKYFGSGVYFHWNFNIPPSFPLINLFYTRYKKVNHSAALKPIKTAIFNRSAV